ncbi:dimethylarginine dimethylaminohydrolase family protein [Pseudoroseomonas cervicalis]|uniref:arginine deiminase n=1 Tax=Pseudoroseomonas cervicalis ATCC 49957 TaxID=525371 RepID=D5RKV1_9PROT|nr:arginine deiminase family protein [Pseudoroseomonas cervicalis]EFH12072.1 Amidinotransferase [Pseudoroseomonas cervicalis ATCC 49957]
MPSPLPPSPSPQPSPWRVASETAPLRDVLVCPPDHYRWLPTNSIARRTLAESRQGPALPHLQAQHAELVAALEQGGARVHRLRPEPHLPYMVYTRDSVVVTHQGPVLCQLERPQRRGEYFFLFDWHRKQASEFWKMSNAGTLEGGDIHILRPGLAVIGHSGGRTDEAGAEQLAGWLRAEGWEVRLQPFEEHFLHLDVLFCMAAPGLAVACEEVLDEDFLAWLRGHGIRTLPVGYRDAMQLGCNILALGGDRVISARGSTALNAALRAEGLTVLDPELSLFTLGGGGPHCLTCPLAREEETA